MKVVIKPHGKESCPVDIEIDFEDCGRSSCEHHERRHYHARRLAMVVSFGNNNLAQGVNMTFEMLSTQRVPVVVSPVLADLLTPSTAVLSNVTYTSADSTIFTVSADPAVPNGAVVTGVTSGTAVMTATATATEADGTSHQITGDVTIILDKTPPPPPTAAALLFTFGTPA